MGSSNRDMLGQAVRLVKQQGGSATQKADLFERLAVQINRLSGGTWDAVRVSGTDGSHVFLGELGEALVISPSGQVFRGNITSGALKFAEQGKLVVDYALLRIL